MRIPTRLDRYPAKMVSRLADGLIERYASDANRILDPFSGSGAILVAGLRAGIPVTGVDLNPIAALFSCVKLKGFRHREAKALASELVTVAQRSTPLPVDWETKDYWFTEATLNKFERLRAAAVRLDLASTNEGMAVLLSMSLSVRLCSRSDQRSPKPFISKDSKKDRQGRHFDPYSTMQHLLDELGESYGFRQTRVKSRFLLGDMAADASLSKRIGRHSHVITSPPYINAQDYFRNFKLELYVLEGLIPYEVKNLRNCFIGTERGDLMGEIPAAMVEQNFDTIPELKALTKKSSRLSAVVHRYLFDMERSFDAIKRSLEPKGRLILVCGDNLIGGVRIRTWQALRTILERKGFQLFDVFSDPIANRMLAPKRCGHKGLIKEEVVCAFEIV